MHAPLAVCRPCGLHQAASRSLLQCSVLRMYGVLRSMPASAMSKLSSHRQTAPTPPSFNLTQFRSTYHTHSPISKQTPNKLPPDPALPGQPVTISPPRPWLWQCRLSMPRLQVSHFQPPLTVAQTKPMTADARDLDFESWNHRGPTSDSAVPLAMDPGFMYSE